MESVDVTEDKSHYGTGGTGYLYNGRRGTIDSDVNSEVLLVPESLDKSLDGFSASGKP